VRQATGSVGDAARAQTEDVVRATSNAIVDQIVAPVKRTWSLVVVGFLLCFIVPLFALRAYAPLNSVVSNLGVVYAAAMIVCPPRFASGRRGRTILLALWPLFLVVFPLALHYWLLHPPAAGPARQVEAFVVGGIHARSALRGSGLASSPPQLACVPAARCNSMIGGTEQTLLSHVWATQPVAMGLVATLMVVAKRLRRHRRL